MCKYIYPNKNSYSVGKYLTILLSLNKNFPQMWETVLQNFQNQN